jgi:DNA-binding LytR/AlgR family response regulator
MLNIAICDDEQKVCAELEAALIDILGKLSIEHETEVYLAGEALCRNMEAGTHYDLIFLDIEFAKNEINGVEVGLLIRDAHQNDVVSIVYISWEKKYSMKLFNIRPLNFLIKPLEYDEVEQVVRTYLQIAGLWSGVFAYKIGHETLKAQIKDIVFLESRDRKLILHLADGRKEKFYGSLKKAYEEQLKRFDFLFIHASYVVNFDYVTSMKYNQLLLTGSSIPLPISQNNRNTVRERYHAIMKRRRAGSK